MPSSTQKLDSDSLNFKQQGIMVPHEAFEPTSSHLLVSWDILVLYPIVFLILTRIARSKLRKEKPYMENHDIRDLDFTDAAWESLYDAVDDTLFLDRDAQLIYNSLRHRLKIRSFGDYLKRYIYLKAGLTEPFAEVPLKEYQLIIRSSFSDNYTPPSFVPTTAKLSALSQNWLTQQTVKRNVVFLLGFGLNMSTDDVNMFLTKALREQEINPKNPFEVICWYCYEKQFNYLKFEQLWDIYNDTPANSFDIARIYSEHMISSY